MLQIIREACVRLATQFDDFWLLAAISDWSFEEGIRGGGNKGFACAVDSFERVGVSEKAIQQLRAGINENLASVLRESGIDVNRNVSWGSDLELRQQSLPSDLSHLEVKMLYDCTTLKYYPEIAADREKLLRRAAANVRCFQVVFFIQLPCFRYPGGRWYGKSKSDKSRQTKRVGIQSQFRQLMTILPHRPTWPKDGPLTHALPFPTNITTEELLLRRYGQIFVPDYPWSFSSEQLGDAAVGVAIWAVPSHHVDKEDTTN